MPPGRFSRVYLRRFFAPLLGVFLSCLAAGSVSGETIDPNLWVTNGVVNSVVRSGNTVYVGGSFDYVGPATGGGVAFDTSSAAVLPSLPKVVGIVFAVIPDGAGGWYIGGSFTSVGGLSRSNVARIAADLSVTPWNPNADQVVFALARNGTTVFAGGSFDTIGGLPRTRIAALDGATGEAILSWYTYCDNTVRTLAIDPVDTTLYVGGDFTTIGYAPRQFIAALSPTTAQAWGWDPNPDSPVRDMALAPPRIFVCGMFSQIGGLIRPRIASLSTADGTADFSWDANCFGVVNTVAVTETTVYVGGSFDFMGGEFRSNIAALKRTDGAAWCCWNPQSDGIVYDIMRVGNKIYVAGDFTAIGGQPRKYIAALDSASGLATGWNPMAGSAAVALAHSGSRIYAGGGFTSVGGATRNNAAAFDATTGVATAWNPNANDDVNTLAVQGTSIYAGGRFTTIGGQPRQFIAELDDSLGVARSWNPAATGRVNKILPAGSKIYVGGEFAQIGGQPRRFLAALGTASGTATAWNPSPNNRVRAVAASGSVVFAGGHFDSIGGQYRRFIGAVDTLGMATPWNPNSNAPVYALALSGTRVFAGGTFDSIGGQARSSIADLNPATGAATSWVANRPYPVSDILPAGSVIYAGSEFAAEGESFSGIAALDANTGLPRLWNPDPRPTGSSVSSLALYGSWLYAGGGFSSIGGQPHSAIAALEARLALSKVQPATGGNTGPVTLLLNGSGIAANSTAKLARTGQPDIFGTDVVVAQDGAALTATFNLMAAAAGGWSARVTNPSSGESTTAPDSFMVQNITSPHLIVDILGPAKIRADRLTVYDVVIQNLGNVDARATPLWITGIPAGSTVQTGPPAAPAPRTGSEPDWSLVPETFASPNGRYLVDVIPHVAPGTVTRRVSISVPPGTPTFVLGAAVTPAWIERPALESCMSSVVASPSCMSAVLEQVNDSLDARPDIKAMSGIGVWAKVGWNCEGAGTLPAALVQAEQALDYMVAAVENGTAAGSCRDVLLPLWRDTLAVNVVFSIDPNDKLGPDGSINKNQAIPYTIRFENMEIAEGDAQHVIVVDPLDLSKLDGTSVKLEAIRFGSHELVPTPGLPTYSNTISLGPNLEVQVSARVDFGVVTWEFRSIDPATPGLPPLLAGFLPPNDTPPQGEGSVLFTVKPLASVPDSAQIRNHAVITMDGSSLTTPETVTRMDQVAPSSEVQDFAPAPDSTRFTVRWSGTGGGIRDYTIYVRKDGGPYWPWRSNTTATADTFHSQPGGHEYAFYSQARDDASFVEAAPLVPDAVKLSRTTANEEVPTWRLALEGARPNPAIAQMRVWFTLPSRERATLELIDVAGRRVSRRDVGGLGPGRHSVELGSPRLQPGLYFIRLSQGRGPALTTRVAYMK